MLRRKLDERAEVERAAGEVRRVEVVAHALDVEAHLQRVPAAQEEDVLARLEGRELEARVVDGAGPAAGARQPGHRDRADVEAGDEAERRVGQGRVQHGRDLAALRRRPRQADPRHAHHRRSERVRVLRRDEVPSRAIGDLLGQERVGLLDVGVVEQDGGVEAALRRQLVIDPAEGVVAARLLVAHRVVLAGVAVAEQRAVGQRIQRQRPGDLRVDGHRPGRQAALAGGLGQGGRDRRLAELLAEALVVAEPEGPVLDQRTAEGDAVLVAMEGRRLLAAIEVVARVHPRCCGGTRTPCRGSGWCPSA